MKDIVEIRWHGRGGQGAKTASLLLAASDSSICVFDVTGGGRPLERLSLHAKQVTCLTQYLCPAQGK